MANLSPNEIVELIASEYGIFHPERNKIAKVYVKLNKHALDEDEATTDNGRIVEFFLLTEEQVKKRALAATGDYDKYVHFGYRFSAEIPHRVYDSPEYQYMLKEFEKFDYIGMQIKARNYEIEKNELRISGTTWLLYSVPYENRNNDLLPELSISDLCFRPDLATDALEIKTSDIDNTTTKSKKIVSDYLYEISSQDSNLKILIETPKEQSDISKRLEAYTKIDAQASTEDTVQERLYLVEVETVSGQIDTVTMTESQVLHQYGGKIPTGLTPINGSGTGIPSSPSHDNSSNPSDAFTGKNIW